MVEVIGEPLDGVKLLRIRRYEDERGHFCETWNARAFEDAGIAVRFVQDNVSRSLKAGTIRGLHYQAPPHAQAKLVRVLAGRIVDVVVDARRGSPHFGRHYRAELGAEDDVQVFVPRGFLHGFMTLEDNCVVQYKVDNFYARGHDGAVRFDDPALGIDWGLPADRAILSQKDRNARGWAEFASPFVYEGQKVSL